MIEDWKPTWTASDFRTVFLPLLFLFSYTYGFYLMRLDWNMINTVPWHASFLIGPMAAAFGLGFITYFLFSVTMSAFTVIIKELTR